MELHRANILNLKKNIFLLLLSYWQDLTTAAPQGIIDN